MNSCLIIHKLKHWLESWHNTEVNECNLGGRGFNYNWQIKGDDKMLNISKWSDNKHKNV